ncbi:MAG TPA: hypothetical protein VKB25_01785 [Conexibacter sp.]|nr:hypothetical protein [Conexibacter sp.]
MTGIDPLQHLTEQLEQTAAQLRSGELEPQQAARLVEDCARLAGEAATELDRRVRAAADAPAAPVVPPLGS